MVALSGGDKLEKRLREIAKKAGQAGVLRVGFLEKATYPDGTKVAQVAAWNQFGHIVKSKDGDYFQMPRPFFTDFIQKYRITWPGALGKIAVTTDYDLGKTLSLMGEGMRKQLQNTIQTYSGPPLAPSTIERKGFDKQLVDTAHMVNSVDYEVTVE